MSNATLYFKNNITRCMIALCALVYSDAGFAAVANRSAASAQKYEIENKASQFDEILGEMNSELVDSGDSELAEKIKKQRAAFNAQAARDTVATQTKAAMSSGKNDCDQKLRACMKSKCGEDYSKCAGDTDTSWGDKMDLCRMDTTCTGEEYRLFTTEIKADRDMNAKLSLYTSIVDCGNKYNDCIITECGQTFTKCLGKSAGDAAVQKCSKIAQNCKEQDSGLPSRVMEVFGNLRGNAEQAIVRDEKRLYELRDAMRDTCDRLGAMFDERSLDCVYTVNFYAGEDGDLYASKKAYAGSTFNCTQEWFGVDITTFMENAFRLTRSQSSASSAALGAGVGMGVGALTSGAIDRAVDRAKAERALGQELCEQNGKGTWQKAINKCKCKNDNHTFDEEQGCIEDAKKVEKAKEREDKENLKKLCETNGKWVGGICYCTDKTHTFDETNGCTTDQAKLSKQMQKETNQAEKDAAKRDCEQGGNGKYIAVSGKCNCNKGYTLSGTHCIKTSTKEKADAKFQEDLNKQKQSIGAKLEQDRQIKLNTTLEESNKQVQDKFAAERQNSLERMEDGRSDTEKQ